MTSRSALALMSLKYVSICPSWFEQVRVCVRVMCGYSSVCMALWFTYTLARVSIKGVETIWSCCFQWFLFPIPFVFILFVFINDLRLGYGKRNAEDILEKHPLILIPLHLYSAPSWHDNVCVWNIYNYLCDPLLGAYLRRYLENVLEFIKPNDPFWDRKNDLDFYVSRRLIFWSGGMECISLQSVRVCVYVSWTLC